MYDLCINVCENESEGVYGVRRRTHNHRRQHRTVVELSVSSFCRLHLKDGVA